MLTATIHAKNKKRKNSALPAPFFLSSIARPERTTNNHMIRLFTALCKSIFESLTDESTFLKAKDGYHHGNEVCPRCGANGKLIEHGYYSRYLAYLIGERTTYSRLSPLRFECKSCGATHALLPDIVIPYGRYSLSFVLTALIAYFERNTTVENICEQFGIAISTIYEWKKRILFCKELMLGLIISQKTPALAFLRGLFGSNNLSDSLRAFFRKYGFSFMQRQSSSASQSRSP